MESLYYMPSPEGISSVDTASPIAGRYYSADEVDKRIAELESELSDERTDRAGLRAACIENKRLRDELDHLVSVIESSRIGMIGEMGKVYHPQISKRWLDDFKAALKAVEMP